MISLGVHSNQYVCVYFSDLCECCISLKKNRKFWFFTVELNGFGKRLTTFTQLAQRMIRSSHIFVYFKRIKSKQNYGKIQLTTFFYSVRLGLQRTNQNVARTRFVLMRLSKSRPSFIACFGFCQFLTLSL